MSFLNPSRARLLSQFSLDVEIVRARGNVLHDASGREYLDFLSQYGALPLGHNPPEIWDAIHAAHDAQTPAMMQPLRSIDAERLAKRLAEIAPGDLEISMLANSGAETVEAAIKLARVRTGRDRILSAQNGFHGKTLGALSATGKPLYQTDFAAPAQGFDYVAFGDLDALETRLKDSGAEIAAFIFEPIQGEGGVVVPPAGYIDGAIALCRRYGVLTIVDEIQTGLGRTGDLFACAQGEMVPDMLLLAKALGGGLMPIGACVVRPSAWDDRFGRLHSSTFANNTLASVAGCAMIDSLVGQDEALVADVRRNGAYLASRLEALATAFPTVLKEVRGRGFMVGLEFQRLDTHATSATMAFSSLNGGATALISAYLLNVHGVLTAPLFNDSHVLRLQPPLNTERADIDRAVEAITDLVEVLARGDYRGLVRHLVSEPLSAPVSSDRPGIFSLPSRHRPRHDPAPGRFGFLIHFTEEEDICRADPSFQGFRPDEMTRWKGWVKGLGPGYAYRIPELRSPTGARADGWLMSLPLLPADMMGKNRNAAARMVNEAVDIAARDGISRVGLGAFTSIVTRGGRQAIGRGTAITTGNTLTTAAAIETIERASARVGISLSQAHVAVIGASGAIGRLAALMLGPKCARLTLVGNAANPQAAKMLSNVADSVSEHILANGASGDGQKRGTLALLTAEAAKLLAARGDAGGRGIATRLATVMQARHGHCPLTWTTSVSSAVADADIVLVATNSADAMIRPAEDLRPGTLVCDVAQPRNVADADPAQSGVLVLDGGLVRPPSGIDLGPFQTLPKGLCWGCLSETMLLSIARQDGDFSIGQELSVADADRLAALAAEHGFDISPFHRADSAITGDQLDQFAADRIEAQAARLPPLPRSAAPTRHHRRRA